MLSSRIDLLMIANQSNLRTAFFSDFAEWKEYKLMEKFLPEFDVLWFDHLKTVVNQLIIDCAFIQEKLLKNQFGLQTKIDYSLLPSNITVTVGVKIAYSK